MPRIRTIKPDFFLSETIDGLGFRARLTFIGLWTHCDDHGRCRDNVKLIKAALWPLEDDVSAQDLAEDIESLVRAGLLFRYTVAGKLFLQVSNWGEHQKVDRPSKSTIPGPDEGTVIPPEPAGHNRSRESREDSTSDREGLALERKGREQGKEQGSASGATRARSRALDLNATAHTPSAHKLVETYAKACKRRPPRSVLNELAVQVDALLAEDWPPDDIANALTAWGAKGLGPKVLPSVANELANKARGTPANGYRSATDTAIEEFLNRGNKTPLAIEGGTT